MKSKTVTWKSKPTLALPGVSSASPSTCPSTYLSTLSHELHSRRVSWPPPVLPLQGLPVKWRHYWLVPWWDRAGCAIVFAFIALFCFGSCFSLHSTLFFWCYCFVLCCVLFHIVLYCIVLCCAALSCVPLYCEHCIMLFDDVLFWFLFCLLLCCVVLYFIYCCIVLYCIVMLYYIIFCFAFCFVLFVFVVLFCIVLCYIVSWTLYVLHCVELCCKCCVVLCCIVLCCVVFAWLCCVVSCCVVLCRV